MMLGASLCPKAFLRPQGKEKKQTNKPKKAESHNDGGGEVIWGRRQGLPGCRVPALGDFVVQGKGREGWRLGEGEGKPPPCGDRSAEPPGLHPGVPRVGAVGRPGSLQCTAWHHSSLGGFCRRVGDISCVPAGAAQVGNAAFPCLPKGTGCLLQEVPVSQSGPSPRLHNEINSPKFILPKFAVIEGQLKLFLKIPQNLGFW